MTRLFKISFRLYIFATTLLCVLMSACTKSSPNHDVLLFEHGSYANAIKHGDTYYYTMRTDGEKRITLWASNSLADIAQGQTKDVWPPKGADSIYHVWAPEIFFINNKWYIYFECDDGNTDNHHIYVLENPSADPMKGRFVLKDTLRTNREWNYGLHPTTFFCRGKQYLLWSGWPKRRNDVETQCIYIASMKNPWTVSSERTMVSEPIYEWERQWINYDGSRTPYPIYVNENPQATLSADGSKVIIYYMASGCWTTFSTLGMAWAYTSDNLLDSHSWHKSSEPLFIENLGDSIARPCDISIVASGDDAHPYLIYDSKTMHNHTLYTSVRMRTISWGKDGLLDFGKWKAKK